MIYLGYCCINLTLGQQGITTNRTMRKDTFLKKGESYASELALKNVQDLKKIITWNINKGIVNFRISSDLFPWSSEYDLESLPDWKDIKSILKEIGILVKDSDIRVSFHPGPFVKLASVKEKVVSNSIKELERHNQIFEVMGLSNNTFYPINIHVGMSYSKEVSDRFCEAYQRLSYSLKKRLVVENDDKPSSYSVEKLFSDIHKKIGIPITFDYFHHSLHPDGLSESEAFHLAHGTWKGLVVPLFHYSESKAIQESINCNATAHSDWIHIIPNDYGKNIYLDLEVKKKELALIQILKRN
jgi:UV DNA damage endonuclease